MVASGLAVTAAVDATYPQRPLGGMTAIHSTPEGCRDYMRSELDKWGQVVKASGARIN